MIIPIMNTYVINDITFISDNFRIGNFLCSFLEQPSTFSNCHVMAKACYVSLNINQLISSMVVTIACENQFLAFYTNFSLFLWNPFIEY